MANKYQVKITNLLHGDCPVGSSSSSSSSAAGAGGSGEQGAQGPPGVAGTDGIIGIDGAQGNQGHQGAGFQGHQGDQGGQGIAGSSEIPFIVTVSSNKFFIDSAAPAFLRLLPNFRYKFDLSDASNGGHLFALSEISDGIHNSGSTYLTGVTKVGTEGNAGAYLLWDVPNVVNDELYYFCALHQNMGGALKMTGADGPIGGIGVQGFQGFQGTKGEDGEYAAIGFQGFQGNVGTDGIIGVDGSQGSQGFQGFQGYGHQGFQGVTGGGGAIGPDGPQGNQGFQGHGHQGYQGLKGDVGDSGQQGDQGYQGAGGPVVAFKVQAGAVGTALVYTWGTLTNSQLQDEEFDTSNAYDISTHKFTPSTEGKYNLHALVIAEGVIWDNTGIDRGLMVQIVKNADVNGSGTVVCKKTFIGGGNTTDMPVEVEGLSSANGTTDNFSVWFQVFDSNSTTGYISSDSIFEGHLLGDGEKGDQGDQGHQGLDGSWGAIGVQGFQGVGGTIGVDGAVGAQGHQGFGHQGFQGHAGINGNPGTDGTDGTDGTQGNQGFQGVDGAWGAIGTQGFQGHQGLGHQGFQGTTGLDGTLGAIGSQGYQGLECPSCFASPYQLSGTLVEGSWHPHRALTYVSAETGQTLTADSGQAIHLIGSEGCFAAGDVVCISWADETQTDGTAIIQTTVQGIAAAGTSGHVGTSVIFHDVPEQISMTLLAPETAGVPITICQGSCAHTGHQGFQGHQGHQGYGYQGIDGAVANQGCPSCFDLAWNQNIGNADPTTTTSVPRLGLPAQKSIMPWNDPHDSYNHECDVNVCGATNHIKHCIEHDPEFLEKYAEQEAAAKKRIESGSYHEGGTKYVIHLWFNVIGDTAGTVTEAVLNQQVAKLNEDFRKLNTDITSRWGEVQADTWIEFVWNSANIANVTGEYNGTPVTNWPYYDSSNPSSDYYDANSPWGGCDCFPVKSASHGGADVVQPTTFLNIWIADLSGGLLGWAQFPGGASSTDGVVIAKNSLPTIGVSPYNLGRTAVHEVGHYLNLRHIWGDGDCTVDDLVSDTPAASDPNFGCPSTARDSCPSYDDPDMWENYMDYTNDSCMSMFTKGQRTRMLDTLQNIRTGIYTSYSCSECVDSTSSTPGEDCATHICLSDFTPPAPLTDPIDGEYRNDGLIEQGEPPHWYGPASGPEKTWVPPYYFIYWDSELSRWEINTVLGGSGGTHVGYYDGVDANCPFGASPNTWTVAATAVAGTISTAACPSSLSVTGAASCMQVNDTYCLSFVRGDCDKTIIGEVKITNVIIGATDESSWITVEPLCSTASTLLDDLANGDEVSVCKGSCATPLGPTFVAESDPILSGSLDSWIKVNSSGNIINFYRKVNNAWFEQDMSNPIPAIGFASATSSVIEGNTSPPTHSVTVDRDTSIGTSTVEYETSDGSAQGIVDYVSNSGTVTWSPGETSKTIDILIAEDVTIENDETFNVTLSNPAHVGSSASITGTNPHVVTIVNDDLVTISFDLVASSIVEGDSGTQTHTVTVNRTIPNSSVTSEVDYATSDGTALAGEDYVATNGTLQFGANITSLTIDIVINGDTDVEGMVDETFNVTLSNATSSVGTPAIGGSPVGLHVVTITNDDSP